MDISISGPSNTSTLFFYQHSDFSLSQLFHSLFSLFSASLSFLFIPPPLHFLCPFLTYLSSFFSIIPVLHSFFLFLPICGFVLLLIIPSWLRIHADVPLGDISTPGSKKGYKSLISSSSWFLSQGKIAPQIDSTLLYFNSIEMTQTKGLPHLPLGMIIPWFNTTCFQFFLLLGLPFLLFHFNPLILARLPKIILNFSAFFLHVYCLLGLDCTYHTPTE